jgi:calcineurin-like phosphoesterase family protein
MATVFVISDTHFGHANMLSFTGLDGQRVRSFESVEAMDEHIVARWNAVVRPRDHVYHLGDVAMRKDGLAMVSRLNGHKRLIPGNHDIFEVKDYLAAGFQKIYGMRVLDGWLMTHIPIHPESLGRFRGNVHGHIHERPSPEGRYINVSVEAVAYTPVALETLSVEL